MEDFVTVQHAVNPTLMHFIKTATDSVMANRKPNQVIQRNGSPYLHRWMLARKAQVPVYDDPGKSMDAFGWMPSEFENLYLHNFIRPDADDPHDHPWPSITLVVNGWYDESIYEAGTNRYIESVRRLPGDVVIRAARSVHAITHTSENCTTLFATLQKEKDWGFFTDTGFIHSRDYHANFAGAM